MESGVVHRRGMEGAGKAMFTTEAQRTQRVFFAANNAKGANVNAGWLWDGFYNIKNFK